VIHVFCQRRFAEKDEIPELVDVPTRLGAETMPKRKAQKPNFDWRVIGFEGLSPEEPA
jgi:hypothetical protein